MLRGRLLKIKLKSEKIVKRAQPKLLREFVEIDFSRFIGKGGKTVIEERIMQKRLSRHVEKARKEKDFLPGCNHARFFKTEQLSFLKKVAGDRKSTRLNS